MTPTELVDEAEMLTELAGRPHEAGNEIASDHALLAAERLQALAAARR